MDDEKEMMLRTENRREVIQSIIRPFHVGLFVSLVSSSLVLITFATNRARRRHPASLIALRSLVDFCLCLLWLVTSLDWTFTANDCEGSRGFYFTAVATEFLVIASESLIACVSFDLLIHAGDPFADYVANVFSYVVLVLGVSASFALGLFVTREEHAGASFLPVCWVKYHGGKVISNANVPMSIFFYAPWSLFFLLSVAALSRACVFLSFSDATKGKSTARLAALRDARRVIFAHASYYGLVLIFYAPLVNAMSETDDAESLSKRQSVLMAIVRFLSGARALENLLVWFPRMRDSARISSSSSLDSSNGGGGGNADLSPLLNVEMQRDVLLSSVAGMCLTLKARAMHALEEKELETTLNLRALDADSALNLIHHEGRRQEDDGDREQDAAEASPTTTTTLHVNVSTPLLYAQSGGIDRRTREDSSLKGRLSRMVGALNKEQILLFVSIAPIQFACLSSGLIAILDKDEPSYVAVLFLTGFLLVAVVSVVSYTIASVQIEGRARAVVKEIKGKEFSHLRTLWKVSEFALIESLSACLSSGGDARFSLSTGRSGAFMFFSPDGRYVVKTIPAKEMRVLIEKILPALPGHALRACPEFTSLARVLGAFSLRVFGRELLAVVTENVLLGAADATKYDLKGSWVKRSSSTPQKGRVYVCEACGKPFIMGAKTGNRCALSRQGHVPRRLLKDNEFRERILGDAELLLRIRAQIERDVDFLAQLGLCDYSLLLCVRHRVVHLSDQQEQSWDPRSRLLLSSVMEGASVFQFGIIDWFTEYDGSKRLERYVKTRLLCAQEKDERGFSGVSATDPEEYKARFLARVVDVVFPLLTNLVQLVDQRRSTSVVLAITLDVSDVNSMSDLCEACSAASGFKVDRTRDEFICTSSTDQAATEENEGGFRVEETTLHKFKAQASRARMCTLILKRKTSSSSLLVAA